MLTNNLEFERYTPLRSAAGRGTGVSAGLVRASFKIYKDKLLADGTHHCQLHLYIGRDVTNKFFWKEGDRIKIELAKTDPRIMRLSKADPSDTQTYVLSGNKNQQSYKLILSWRKFVPENRECLLRVVQHITDQGGLVVYLH